MGRASMRSKLSFSIAVHLTTELILIDELLSVGDMAFRQKSYAKIKELITDDKHTVVIVSHDIGRLRNLCDRVLWLEGGKIRMLGDPKTVTHTYQQEYAKTEKTLLFSDVQTPELVDVRNIPNGLCVVWGLIIGYRVKHDDLLHLGAVGNDIANLRQLLLAHNHIARIASY